MRELRRQEIPPPNKQRRSIRQNKINLRQHKRHKTTFRNGIEELKIKPTQCSLNYRFRMWKVLSIQNIVLEVVFDIYNYESAGGNI